MTTSTAKVALAIERPLHARLCAIAKRQNLSVEDYCQRAVADAIERDAPLLMTVGERLNALDQIDALRRRIFGEQAVQLDSAEIIREGRAIRDDQIDRAVRGDWQDDL